MLPVIYLLMTLGQGETFADPPQEMNELPAESPKICRPILSELHNPSMTTDLKDIVTSTEQARIESAQQSEQHFKERLKKLQAQHPEQFTSSLGEQTWVTTMQVFPLFQNGIVYRVMAEVFWELGYSRAERLRVLLEYFSFLPAEEQLEILQMMFKKLVELVPTSFTMSNLHQIPAVASRLHMKEKEFLGFVEEWKLLQTDSKKEDIMKIIFLKILEGRSFLTQKILKELSWKERVWGWFFKPVASKIIAAKDGRDQSDDSIYVKHLLSTSEPILLLEYEAWSSLHFESDRNRKIKDVEYELKTNLHRIPLFQLKDILFFSWFTEFNPHVKQILVTRFEQMSRLQLLHKVIEASERRSDYTYSGDIPGFDDYVNTLKGGNEEAQRNALQLAASALTISYFVLLFKGISTFRQVSEYDASSSLPPATSEKLQQTLLECFKYYILLPSEEVEVKAHWLLVFEKSPPEEIGFAVVNNRFLFIDQLKAEVARLSSLLRR